MPKHIHLTARKLRKTKYREDRFGFHNGQSSRIHHKPARRNRTRLKTVLVLFIGIGIGIGASVSHWIPHDSFHDAEQSVVELARGLVENVRIGLDGLVGEANGASGDIISGKARVLDGDTLHVGYSRIRMYGIDAPETAQMCSSSSGPWPCGAHAGAALGNAIRGRTVSCQIKGEDRYNRALAICHAGNTDLNGWMVQNGWAFAYRQYSSRYVQNETAARSARIGIWRGEVVPPWDWRKGKRLSAAVSRPSAPAGNSRPGCHIKGNISSSGRRVYHVPGGAYYDATQINTRNGERWFCTEREARAAGWRRSGR